MCDTEWWQQSLECTAILVLEAGIMIEKLIANVCFSPTCVPTTALILTKQASDVHDDDDDDDDDDEGEGAVTTLCSTTARQHGSIVVRAESTKQ